MGRPSRNTVSSLRKSRRRRRLSHVTPEGEARMVDVAEKPTTRREASASAILTIRKSVLDLLMRGELPKGEALATARIAAIQATKRTSDWIPLCHPLGLDWVGVEFERVAPGRLRVVCTARATARTGVEMEALTGAAAAALTIYDMAKGADKSIVIGPLQLEGKSGGRSGDFRRTPS